MWIDFKPIEEITMLDKKIVGFKQTVREFFTSKTNQLAIITIVTTVVSFYLGKIDLAIAAGPILGSLFAMTIKDATI